LKILKFAFASAHNYKFKCTFDDLTDAGFDDLNTFQHAALLQH